MRIVKRVVAATGLTGMLAALALAAPAGAATADRIKGVCITGGIAKAWPPVPFGGGTGSYTYIDLIFACVGVELSKGTAVAASLIELNLSSSGSYTNVMCGTGKIVSTPNGAIVQGVVVVPIVGEPKMLTMNQWAGIAQDLDYVAEVVAFKGLLKWTDTEGQKLSSELPKLLTAGPSGFPGGYFEVEPDQNKALTLPTICSKAFQVNAVLVIDWAPDNPIV